jgi:hypothetical protein
MDFLYAIFFGAGTTALAYNTLGRRVGYSNSKNLVKTLAAIFIFTTLIFFTILAFIIHAK